MQPINNQEYLIMPSKNLSVVPRIGNRASVKINRRSQCTGAEWTRKANASFFGTLDVGKGKMDSTLKYPDERGGFTMFHPPPREKEGALNDIKFGAVRRKAWTDFHPPPK